MVHDHFTSFGTIWQVLCSVAGSMRSRLCEWYSWNFWISTGQTSKPVLSEQAKEAGLVDAVVPLNELVPVAKKYALEMATGKQPWRRTLSLTDRLGSKEECLEILKQARASAQKTYRNVPHPFKMLDAIEEGLVNGGVAGTLKVWSRLIIFSFAEL